MTLKKINTNTALKAAQYVRMSTDHQQYSTTNQADKIREYAQIHNIEIIQSYEDDGKSGLNINGRPSLKKLLNDVKSGNINFSLILVYDVSRWGRFQDADEGAYYEFICRSAGVNIIYCAEPFSNDNSLASKFYKNIKRAMAGEYSRELSGKVFTGQKRLIELGYRQGGTAGFGLRRAMLNAKGEIKAVLEMGEHKSFQLDRIILVPGPKEEIETVQQIYHWFIDEHLNELQIAKRLNLKKIKTDFNREWTRNTVHEILTNPKYIGHNLFNRTSNKLKEQHIKNPSEQWVRKDNAFEAIVSEASFYTAQGIIRKRSYRYTDKELIQQLKTLYQKHGYLSGSIINKSKDTPTSSVYFNRFGSLLTAYNLIGFYPKHDYKFLEINKFLRRLYPEILEQTIDEITKLKAVVHKDPLTNLIHINNEFTISLVITKAHLLAKERCQWKVRLDTILNPDITVVIRLDNTNTKIKDYYLLPRSEFIQNKIILGETNRTEIERYRYDNLNFLYKITEHEKWTIAN